MPLLSRIRPFRSVETKETKSNAKVSKGATDSAVVQPVKVVTTPAASLLWAEAVALKRRIRKRCKEKFYKFNLLLMDYQTIAPVDIPPDLDIVGQRTERVGGKKVTMTRRMWIVAKFRRRKRQLPSISEEPEDV